MTKAWTLYTYLGRQILLGGAAVFGGVAALAFMIDLVEMLRRASGKEDVGFFTAMALSLLKLPSLTEKILPFAILFGAMFTFARLTRNQELTIVRASGMSIWQMLLPAVALTGLLGVVAVTVYNPFAATLATRFEQLEARYLKGRPSLLAVSSSGLWLRQADENGQSVIHALRVSAQGLQLDDVIIFLYDTQNRFSGRIDAEHAALRDGYWLLQNAWETGSGRQPVLQEQLVLRTTLTPTQIQDSFASPETISFWELPRFIATAEAAGFSALRHRLHFYALLATPFLFCAMALIAASFSLRMSRLGGVSTLFLAGSFAGFLLYFISDVTHALGLSGILPALLAAWSPAAVALLLGAATLLHLEDG